ncbi:uncharacterized protein MYCFIDRAFT_97848 [Pseudocercospora fijiensis CIRAD86]
MGFRISYLWSAPAVNPINRKARTIPVLNPINNYGRVFFFSWFGFLLAFWSWYAFPPLLHEVIAKDLKLTQIQVSNSNIIALCATLLVRLVAGPCCDRFGPRRTFAGCLLLGAIPTWLAGTAYNVSQLYALRFFIGILGGSFVPCQVWTTGFYDKNIVGTANALTAGLGNAGGGITYFVMPAVYNSLVGDGLTPHVAWRVTFIVPGILITSVAFALLLLCDDTPTGKWSERAQANLRLQPPLIVDIPGQVNEKTKSSSNSGTSTPAAVNDEEKKLDQARPTTSPQLGSTHPLNETIQPPSLSQTSHILLSPQTLVLASCYFCTFGAELSLNSILGTYYLKTFRPSPTPETASNWAAMFGLMNILFRPLGGAISDVLYSKLHKNIWAKKALLHTYNLLTGTFLVVIGTTDPHSLTTLVCLIGVALAFFLEGGNGVNFSLVPHVYPRANGVVSGVTGASGNLGGIVFAGVFRCVGEDMRKGIWIVGVVILGVNAVVCWVRPVPKGNFGG